MVSEGVGEFDAKGFIEFALKFLATFSSIGDGVAVFVIVIGVAEDVDTIDDGIVPVTRHHVAGLAELIDATPRGIVALDVYRLADLVVVGVGLEGAAEGSKAVKIDKTLYLRTVFAEELAVLARNKAVLIVRGDSSARHGVHFDRTNELLAVVLAVGIGPVNEVVGVDICII